jgi:hypothetical protein
MKPERPMRRDVGTQPNSDLDRLREVIRESENRVREIVRRENDLPTEPRSNERERPNSIRSRP